ncbi:hypothetical protein K435DRAFT_937124 [Dendrothele bispora CBS 962.96]|uniref:Uncharacterized protein n=1 Tax=Dendrothele bispora (strain CBS 962.96) TaxID=1314807 RepID=A0A4S8KZV9_DENBC|nr:hypothetical protein K435DRAFT_937124 [Dendrothele bispora CBS 962.96]
MWEKRRRRNIWNISQSRDEGKSRGTINFTTEHQLHVRRQKLLAFSDAAHWLPTLKREFPTCCRYSWWPLKISSPKKENYSHPPNLNRKAYDTPQFSKTQLFLAQMGTFLLFGTANFQRPPLYIRVAIEHEKVG